MTRKILIAFAALLLLAVAALLIGPSFVDWNVYKQQIEETAHKATGRDLRIDGDISLALLPVPKLSVKGVRFANAEGASAPDMATIDALDVQVAPLPLLSGKIQVTSLTLVKPTVLLERLADGRGNWQIGPAEGAAAPAPSEAAREGDKGAGGFDLSFDSVRIENGTFIYRDAVSGSEQKLEALDARIKVGSLQGPFEANGTATYRGIRARFGVDAGMLAAGQPVPVRLLLGAGDPEARIEFAGTVTTDEGGPSLAGKLTGGGDNLGALLDALSAGAGASPLVQQKFSIAADVTGSAAGGDARNLTIALGDQQATGEASVTRDDTIKAKLALSLPQLDLDKLIADAKTAGAGDGGQTETVPAEGAGAPPGFALPQNVAADIDLGIEAISYNGGVVNKARLVAALANGELSLTRFTATLPGGSDVALAGKLATVEGLPSFAGTLELHSDNLRGLLEWLKVAMPDVPPDRLRKMSLASRVSATPSQVQIAEMDLRLDSSRIAGGIVVALPNGQRKVPGLGIGLAIDKLNLDAYLPPKAQGTAPAAATQPTQNQGTGTQGGAGQAGGGQGGSTADAGKNAGQDGGLPLDALKPLAGLNANLEIKVGSLTLNRQTANGVHLDATLQGGVLTLRDLSVKDFAGGSGSFSGTVNDLAGTPTLDSQFSLKVADATRALQFAGLENPPKKLGKLVFDGKLSGGGQQIAYDISFDVSGIGASGKAKGTASGLGAGIPRIDSDFTLAAKNAGPLLELAGLAGAADAKLGALDFAGTAKSGGDQLTYNVAFDLAGIGGKGSVEGSVAGLQGTPQVDTRIDLAADKPAALLTLLGMDGPTAAKLGALALKGTLQGSADDMALDLALDGLGGSVTARGTVKAVAKPASFDLALSATHPELRQLAAAFVPKAAPGPESLGPLTFAATATGTTEAAKIANLSLKMGPSDLAGSIDYAAPAGARPMVTANLTSTLFDVSPFVAAPQGTQKKNAPAAERWSTEPMDLSALDGLDADVTAKIQRFVMNDTRIDNLDAHFLLKDGTLAIDRFTGNTYGGTVDLAGTLASRGIPTFKGRFSGTNLDSNELMGGGLLADRITGPLTVTTDVTGAGASMAELVGSLNGNGNLAGTITVLSKVEQTVGSVGLNLLGSLAQKKLGSVGTQLQGLTQVADAAYRAFTGVPNSLTGDFQIQNGQIKTDNLALANANARALARGTADLPAWTLDLLATVFRAPDLNQPFLELSLNGVLDSPNTKFKGFQGAAAPAPGDLLQQVLPDATGGGDQQQQQPGGGFLQKILPGMLGEPPGGESGAPAPAQPPSGAEPGAAGVEAPSTEAPPAPPEQPAAPSQPSAPASAPPAEPGAAGVEAPSTELPPAQPEQPAAPSQPSETPAAPTGTPPAEPGTTGVETPPAGAESPAPADTQPAQPSATVPPTPTDTPPTEPGASGVGQPATDQNSTPSPAGQQGGALNKLLQGILQQPQPQP
ncbi:MAG: AsmA family protein [Pseudomonadota bacterium]